MSKRTTLHLVDGSGYIFRAYFAVRRLSTSSGIPTNAVFGVITMLLKLLKDHAPTHLAVVFDTGSPTFRHQMYPAYKAHRPPPPEDLVPQFSLVQQAVQALAIPVLSLEGYEADDLLGTLARQAEAQDLDVVIMTGDKDLMQLVDEHVTLYDGMKDKVIGIAEVIERFGVPPAQVIDVLALAGDSSDNVPGVQGIGEKTGSALVQEFGDLEAVLAAAPGLKQKARRERLMTQAEQARLSRRLVTIATDAPVSLDLEAMRYGGPDLEACRRLFTELEFHRLLREPPFAAAGGDEPALPTPLVEGGVDRSHYSAITDLPGLEKVLESCRQAGRFAVDTETDSLDPMRAKLVGLSLSWAPGEAVYIPCGHDPAVVPDQLPAAIVVERVGALLADTTQLKVAQNGKYDRTVLLNHGVPAFDLDGDPMLASYLLDPGENSHGLDTLALRYLGHRNIAFEEVCGRGKDQVLFSQVPLEKAVPYAAEDADVALRLEGLLRPRLDAANLIELYDELELPLERVLCDIERRGVRVDGARLDRMAEEMHEDLKQIETHCVELAGHAFNLASPRQVAQVLFEELGLPVIKKTKTGASTDAEVLEALSPRHELPRQLLEHRLIAKLKSTYVDVLPRLVHPSTGRVHTQYNQAVAATGRLSSSDPNLQNIPVRSPQGRRIREAFVAEPGHVLISADYSQIELRILAHVTGDPRFVEAFVQGQDIHARTASEIFGMPLDQVGSEERRRAKTINFGLLYGMGAFRLAQQLGISNADARQYLDTYFERYAGIRRWHDATLIAARTEGLVSTMYGRRRLLPDLASKNHNLRAQAERIAINTPIQGTAADIIKRAMLRTEASLAQVAPSARMILQVHDELVVEVQEAEAGAASAALVTAMQQAATLAVPLLVDVGTAHDWSHAH